MILKENEMEPYSKSPLDFDAASSIPRAELPYENLSQCFRYSSKDFTKQFAHIYAGRLTALKPRLIDNARAKWGETIPIHILSELSDNEGKRCVVIGTTYKHQELKPSLLKEISEEHQLVPQPALKHFTSPSDLLILEDETQRIRLQGGFDVSALVTGVAVAVLGRENEDGRFEIEDYCYAGADLPLVSTPTTTPTDDCYVALVSGLELGSSHDLLSVQLLCDWLSGVSGGPTDQSEAAKVCRLVIAGNSVGPLQSSEVPGVGSITDSSVLDAVKEFDNVCFELSQSIPSDVMPGEHDPSNHTLPQQAFHSCMFPLASTLQSFRLVSNPYQFSVGGRRLLGTSGQPIDNLAQITDGLDRLSLLQSSLEWGHLAPSAPDTLPCYPYYQTDPFIIQEMPDVYFAGNQSEFSTKVYTSPLGKSVRLVCIPKFAATKTFVLVNLRNLDCFVTRINVETNN